MSDERRPGAVDRRDRFEVKKREPPAEPDLVITIRAQPKRGAAFAHQVKVISALQGMRKR